VEVSASRDGGLTDYFVNKGFSSPDAADAAHGFLYGSFSDR
jgi:hypothetical protein